MRGPLSLLQPAGGLFARAGSPSVDNDLEGYLLDNSSRDNLSVRTSIITLTVLNVVFATVTVGHVIYDTWRRWTLKEERAPLYRRWKRLAFLKSVSAAETVPLALSIATIVQGTIFAGAQGTTLRKETVLVRGCAKTADWVWPSTWIVLYTAFVFGVEAVIRYLKTPNFQTRGRWNSLKCVAVIAALLLITWIPSVASPSPDLCLGGVAWWSASHSMLAVMIFSGLLVLLLITAVVITLQLVHGVRSPTSQDERRAASDMVYYLVLMATSICFILPFFTAMTMSKPAADTSFIATVVLNLMGILVFFIRLTLRFKHSCGSYASNEHFGSKGNFFSRDRQSCSSRAFSFRNHITSPVTPPPLPVSPTTPTTTTAQRPGSAAWPRRCDSLARNEPARHPLKSLAATPEAPEIVITRTPSTANALDRPSLQKTPSNSKYSLFPLPPQPASLPPRDGPTRRSDRLRNSLLDNLHLPRPAFLKSHHRRSGSNATSATVQIGLRLSGSVDAEEEQRLASSRGSSLLPPSQRSSARRHSRGALNPTPGRHDPEKGLMSPPLLSPRSGAGAIAYGGLIAANVGTSVGRGSWI